MSCMNRECPLSFKCYASSNNFHLPEVFGNVVYCEHFRTQRHPDRKIGILSEELTKYVVALMKEGKSVSSIYVMLRHKHPLSPNKIIHSLLHYGHKMYYDEEGKIKLKES